MFARAIAPFRVWLTGAEGKAGRLGYSGATQQDVMVEGHGITRKGRWAFASACRLASVGHDMWAWHGLAWFG